MNRAVVALLLMLAQDPAPLMTRTVAIRDPRLSESSAVAVSRTYAGLLWSINDSGNPPVLFLTDSGGRALAVFQVRGAVNIDWEAMGTARCGEWECLIIGDTGDNDERRRSVMLYRVREPSANQRTGLTRMVEALQVRYPDRPHDVEALYAEPDGSVVLITKGRRGGVLTFRIPVAAWATHRPVTAIRWDSLPIEASMLRGRVVTDAAISPDGTVVVVRTYREIRYFARGKDGRLRPFPGRPLCDISGLEPQGEGLGWWNDSTLVLTSERGLAGPGTITLLQCPSR